MKTSLLKNIAKWLWTAAALAFIILFAASRRHMLPRMFSMLPPGILIGAFLLIVLAKLCFVTNMWKAAAIFSINLRWGDAYCIYNLTQLAKYMPGSIWQFVGRFAVLRGRGVSMQAIRDSTLVELAWVAITALVLGSGLAAFSCRGGRPGFFPVIFGNRVFSPLILLLFASVATFFVLPAARRWMLWILKRIRFHGRGAVLILASAWVFLGISFWMIINPFASEPFPITYCIGVYCLAYLTGLLFPFAPAGLGVREAVLVAAVAGYTGAETAVILAAINRVLYFLAEMAVAAPCLAYKKGL